MDEDKSKISQLEEETALFWQKNKIFEKSIESRPESDKFVFYDGPPFATGLPHYGHILSSVTKDLFPRYQTMKGKRVRRRWGWDCHGLPIETLVEKKLGISGKKQIEEKGVDLFNQTARSMVLEYVSQWKEMASRIGRWVEFDNSYKTMDTSYMESVWWALKKLWDDGLVYEGRKVLMYCPRCETPVSNAEVSMDNSYKDVTDETVTVKFKLKPGQKFGKNYETKDTAYILAWTTTPWTLPANVALAVGAEIEYTALRVKGVPELYIVASKLVEKIFACQKIETVHNDLMGKDLEGLEYEPLYEIKKVKDSGKKAWYVTTADFVTTEDGTGVVHTAVIYGEDDFNLGQKIDLPQAPLLDSSGHYNLDTPEFLQGKFYKEAEKEIKKDLNDRGLLFSKTQHTHSYPFCWRCDSPLIYNAISAWFVDIQKNKQKLIDLNEKINWYPAYLKHGRFLNILETAPDWNISRNRYWATPLPFFKCQKCGKTECIGSIDELKQKSTNFDRVYPNPDEIDLHKPYIDDVELKCSCGEKVKRIPEVIDCWVESGSMPFAEWHYPFENKNEFESRFPGDFIGEYISQTRAWFYYMHAVGALVFNDASFKNVVSTGVILNDKGEKMSKSKQNYPDPWKMINAYGADALRFYIMGSVVMQADNLFFNERELREVYNKVINTLENIVKFYEIYQPDNKAESGYSPLTPIDRYIVSKLVQTAEDVTRALDEYNSVKACRHIRLFIEELSTWWLRRSRERFRDEGEDRQTAVSTLRYVLHNLALVCAPIIPFESERIFQRVKFSDDPESVHLAYWPKFSSDLRDEKLEKEMTQVQKIVELAHNLRSSNSLKVRQPLAALSFNVDFSQNQEEYEKIILEELNIEKVVKKEVISQPESASFGEIEVTIETRLDERLRELGDLREFTRAIQDKRKKAGLKPGELTELMFFSESQDVKNFIEKFSRQICQQTALSRLSLGDDSLDSSETVLSSGKIKITL